MRSFNKLLLIFFLVIASIFKTWAQRSLLEFPKNYKSKSPVTIWASSKNSNVKISTRDYKPVIDSSAIKHWVCLEKNKITVSKDGNYFMYSINNQPYMSNTLVVQSMEGFWKKELVGVKDGLFSGDSKQFVYMEKNVLCFLDLGTNKQRFIENVISYQTPQISNFPSPPSFKGEWLFYQLNNKEKELVVYNFITNKEMRYSGVIGYRFDEQGTILILKRLINQGLKSISTLDWVNLQDGSITPIWSLGNNLQLMSYKLDPLRKQICFLVLDSSKNKSTEAYSIWYYKLGMTEPVMAVNNRNPGIDSSLGITALASPGFSLNGRYLYFYLKDVTFRLPNPEAAQVDVWNYRDSIVQSGQLNRLKTEPDKYLSVVNIEKVPDQNVQVIRLVNTGESFITGSLPSSVSGDFVVIQERKGGERFWENEVIYKLVNMKDGSRKSIYIKNHTQLSGFYFWFSPGGQYLIYYNDDHNYYSYNLYTGEKVNISKAILSSLSLENPHYQRRKLPAPVGLVGWIGNDESILVYDNYDIWKLDLVGSKPPVNITGGYGRIHNYKIRLIGEGNVYSPEDTVILSIFNLANKYNGLYRVVLASGKVIDEPLLEPHSIYYNSSVNQAGAPVFEDFLPPIRIGKSNAWIVKRESALDAPNYFLTHNFREYKALTNVQFQKRFNWLTSELMQWIKPDGSFGYGVLYKPENFDPLKKYPVLIDFYEGKSGRLHQFPVPEFISATHINVAWFVSHGYLVFAPDMVLKEGKVVESVCSTLISCAQSLALLPYVDGKKMGISSYSWGGVQTNWLVSQTNIFAAVATGGGSMGADPVSTAFQIRETKGVKGEDMGEYVERLLGSSFWEKPERWLDVSPVLRADKINSPLLMLHNYGEFAWQQDVELFMALRRLNKKVWLLQYDNGTHGLYGRDAEDFTIRITQFFDHYLKGAPMPRWMSQGIPAKLKGIERGYEFDIMLGNNN